MNDQDLERALRSERGPREDGYTPARLPMTLEHRPGTRPARSVLPRAAIFAGVALAGALAVAVVAGMLSGPGREVGGTDSASPSTSPSTTEVGMCQSGDLIFGAEAWGGAAGSRGTVVTVALATGRPSCTLASSVTAQILDANGTVLVSGASAAANPGLPLDAGDSYTVGIAWSNWCDAAPAAPVSLQLKLGGWPDFVGVSTPDGGSNPVPPCNGQGDSSLSLTELQPQS